MKFYDLEGTEEGPAGGGVCRRTASPAEASDTAHNPQRGTMGAGGERKALRQGSAAAALLVALAMAATAQTRVDLRTQAKNVDFSAAASTKPSKTGTTLPAACAVGETFLKTDAPAGNNLYVCTPANTWNGQGTPGATGNADKVLSNDGATTGWRTMGGDVGGKPDALTVAKIQGRAVSATAPAAGQLLTWNNSIGVWEPANLAFGGDASGGIGSLTVTALRNRTVSTAAPANGQALVWNSAVSQWQPQTLAGGGGVPSVYGRTGSVTAQTGDYTFGQISGTVTDSQVATGINTNKIGGGSVSNAAFGYLANVTSDLQTQLTGRALTNQPVGGDVSGTLGGVTVAALRGRSVAGTAPANGQALVWNSSSSQWQPQNVAAGDTGGGVGGAYSSSFTSQTTVIIPGSMHQLGTANLLVGCYDTSVPAVRVQPNTVSVHPALFDVTITFAVSQSGRCVVSSGGSGSGGSSGGGASMGAQLGDFNVTETSPTVLTIGPNCSTATPCNVRWGGRVYTFTSSNAVTLTEGAGTAYFYVDSNGTLTAGHNLTLTCTSPCSAAAGVTAFPVNAIPLFTWTATSGTWDTAGASDKRAFLSGKTLNAGT